MRKLAGRHFNSLLATIPEAAMMQAPLKARARSATAPAMFPWAKGKYEPSWESISSHPIPAGYTEARFGISMHWRLYSASAHGEDHRVETEVTGAGSESGSQSES